MIMALLLILAGPLSGASESVDLIEVNHFHDTDGKPVYDQVIFYDWYDCAGHFHVRHWMLLNPKNPLERMPIESVGRVHVQWYDHNENLFRDLSGNTFKVTWTQVDHERENKRLLDERERVGLYRRLLPISEKN